MNCAFFVTGTDTGVGKTHVTCALLHATRRLGLTAVGMKPIAAGVEADGRNDDVVRLLAECWAAGWQVRVWERRAVRRHYPDARNALRSVKAVGAREVEQRRPTPLGRSAWQAINGRYEQLREAAGLPLTYVGVWLIATRP